MSLLTQPCFLDHRIQGKIANESSKISQAATHLYKDAFEVESEQLSIDAGVRADCHQSSQSTRKVSFILYHDRVGKRKDVRG